MYEAMMSFLELVKGIAPYSIAWGLGIKAYRYVVNAFLGRDARL